MKSYSHHCASHRGSPRPRPHHLPPLSSLCARLYAARTLFRSACASCNSIRSEFQPSSLSNVDAMVRNPCPVMSSFEKTKRLNAALTVPSEIGQVTVRSEGKTERPEPVGSHAVYQQPVEREAQPASPSSSFARQEFATQRAQNQTQTIPQRVARQASQTRTAQASMHSASKAAQHTRQSRATIPPRVSASEHHVDHPRDRAWHGPSQLRTETPGALLSTMSSLNSAPTLNLT